MKQTLQLSSPLRIIRMFPSCDVFIMPLMASCVTVSINLEFMQHINQKAYGGENESLKCFSEMVTTARHNLHFIRQRVSGRRAGHNKAQQPNAKMTAQINSC